MFKRPENLEFPQIFHKFMAKGKNSDEFVEYRVQDLPEEFFDQAVDFMVKYYLPDETLTSSRDVANKPSAIEAFREFWHNTLKQKISIACFRNDGSGELIGVNVLTISSRNDPEFDLNQLTDENVIDMVKAMIYTTKKFDIYEAYNVDQYLTSFGLSVNREYRGRGIATEMLKARAPILKALGLKVTSTIFSAVGSQAAAKNAGFEEVVVLPFTEIEKIIPAFDFSKSAAKYFKMMALNV